MATSRSKAAALLLAAACLACTPRQEQAPVGAIQRPTIEHVTPKRDFVGATPARLEWTAVEGAEQYHVTINTEIDTLILEQRGVKGTSIEWPRELELEPGTYFWRVVAMSGGRTLADSGRAAFVVRN